MMSKTKRSIDGGRGLSGWLLVGVLVLFLIYALGPILYIAISSTKTNGDLFGTFGFAFGKTMNLDENLRDLIARDDGIFLRWMLNSVIYATSSAIGAGLFSTMAGYAFAKFEFSGKRMFFGLVFVAVLVPQTALIVPLFLLLSVTGLANNPLGVILPSMILPIGVYMMRYYIERAIDDGIIDAARVDGASELRIFKDVVIRLAAPGMVTVMLLSFVGNWNNYFLPLIVLRSQELFPVTVGLANWYQLASAGGGGGQVLFSIIITGALLSVIPVIAVFMMLQRYWQGGLASGAVK